MEPLVDRTWAKRGILMGNGRTASRRISLRSAALVRLCPLLPNPGHLDQPARHERLRALSADFRFGGTVAGGERDLEAPGAGNRGAGRFCRHPLGMPAVSTADADSRLRRATVAAFGQLPVP